MKGTVKLSGTVGGAEYRCEVGADGAICIWVKVNERIGVCRDGATYWTKVWPRWGRQRPGRGRRLGPVLDEVERVTGRPVALVPPTGV
jgi:hypothetical protein